MLFCVPSKAHFQLSRQAQPPFPLDPAQPTGIGGKQQGGRRFRADSQDPISKAYVEQQGEQANPPVRCINAMSMTSFNLRERS